MKNILVIGGAGYIGSHCVHQLVDSGESVTVLDNLSLGHREALPAGAHLVVGELSDRPLIEKVLIERKIDVVMHFAAYGYVGESMGDPLKYYENNVANTINLLGAMKSVGVKKIIFSSTCATFGISEQLPITEETSQQPINPYGETKLTVEKLLRSLCESDRFTAVALRYFNAAGAGNQWGIGEDHDPECHLIPLVIKAALDPEFNLKVFGDDYDTADGTCLRDYIHVCDVATAHQLALGKLDEAGVFHDFNLGTGQPVSVLEIIEEVERQTDQKIIYTVEPRRQGDPPSLYTDATKASVELGWSPIHSDLDNIISTAHTWHKTNPQGFETSHSEEI